MWCSFTPNHRYTLNMCLLQQMKTRWGELLATFPLLPGRIDLNLALEIVRFLHSLTNFVLLANKTKIKYLLSFLHCYLIHLVQYFDICLSFQ
jgi:hypothetical protein